MVSQQAHQARLCHDNLHLRRQLGERDDIITKLKAKLQGMSLEGDASKEQRGQEREKVRGLTRLIEGRD